MTFEMLKKIIKENNIPEDVTLRSNSGWECNATEMDGIWYSRQANVIHFTQNGWPSFEERLGGFELIYGDNKFTQHLEEQRHQICEYFEDALIYMEEDKLFPEPYIFVEMESQDTSDYLFYEDSKWLHNSLDTLWAEEIVGWSKYHIDELQQMEENHNYHMINERWK